MQSACSTMYLFRSSVDAKIFADERKKENMMLGGASYYVISVIVIGVYKRRCPAENAGALTCMILLYYCEGASDTVTQKFTN